VPTKGGYTIVVTFPTSACQPCAARTDCTRSTAGRRQLSLRPREIHQAQIAARTVQSSQEWKDEYKLRAGVEGTMHQAVTTTGARHARYLGLDKTRLQHTFAAAAINLIRLDAFHTGKPLDRGHTSHLARLAIASCLRQIGVRGLPVPGRGNRPGRPLVPARQPVLP
jgi:hypothetical protein